MQQLLDQITETLGPQLAGPIAERFGLSSDKASEAVPAVARPLLSNLRQKAEAPEQNLGLLSALQGFLTDESKPTGECFGGPPKRSDGRSDRQALRRRPQRHGRYGGADARHRRRRRTRVSRRRSGPKTPK